jgi:hypothetical protein
MALESDLNVEMSDMAYAQLTLAISDQCPGGLDGFAPLSDPLPEAVFTDAVEDGLTMTQSGATHSVFVDLMEGGSQVDEKCISIEQAARILGIPPETVVPLGRQRLAQIDDEDAEYFATRNAE